MKHISNNDRDAAMAAVGAIFGPDLDQGPLWPAMPEGMQAISTRYGCAIGGQLPVAMVFTDDPPTFMPIVHLYDVVIAWRGQPVGAALQLPTWAAAQDFRSLVGDADPPATWNEP